MQGSSGRNSRPLLKWGGRLLAIFFGLFLGWLLIEILFRSAFGMLPYPIQVATRHVYRTPFGDERILPEQIWQEDGNFQFISRSHIDNELQFPDPRVSFHVSTKNWIDPNSHVGFRVPSPAWEPRWPVDILVAGDSMSFCYTEYSDCWVQLLETDHGLSTVNLGQVATGSDSRLNLLRTFGLPNEPKVVIWQWYGNDYNDDYGFAVDRGEIDDDTPPGSVQIPEPATVMSKWLHEHSVAYRLAYQIRHTWGQPAQNDYLNDPYWLSQDDVNLAFGRSYNYDSTDMSNPNNQQGMQISNAKILEARDLVEASGARLLIVLIPNKEEVYADWMEPALGADYLDSLAEGRHLMMAFCYDEGITCIDTTDALAEFALQGNQVYFPLDTHLNELGNQLLADIVLNSLVSEGFIPPN